jgi:hypothetical protein
MFTHTLARGFSIQGFFEGYLMDLSSKQARRAASRRLTEEEQREFVAFFKEGLKQYGLVKADLADEVEKPEEEEAVDRLHEKHGAQTRLADPLESFSREKMRRFVENALTRPQTIDIATRLVFRIANARKTTEWRKKIGKFENDPWFEKCRDLIRAGKPFVDGFAWPRTSDPDVRVFINPYDVEQFTNECLEDIAVWIQPKQKEQIKRSLIRSIEKRAEHRARALRTWALQLESFLDIRIFEGPYKDQETGAIVAVKEMRIKRAAYGSEDLIPWKDGERQPQFYERLEAIMFETLTKYAASKKKS